LTATNECGSSEVSNEVVAAIIPIAGFTNSASDGCVTHTVEFTSTSSNSDSYLWEFEGGTPSTSTEENPIVDYTTTGTFDVSVTVTNAYGSDEITLEDLIVVEDLPNTDFDYVTEIYTTSFTNTTEEGDNPTWDFGDGNTSTEENPTHTYDAEGTYFVTLTTENNCGQSVQTEPVTINDTPSIFISANVTESCLPNATFTFSDESINSDEILWEFPGGNPSTSMESNPTVTYDAVGTYDVIVIATNSSGSNEITFEDYVTVDDEPTAQFSVTNDGLDINITNTSEYGITYDWDLGDGSSSSEFEPVHTYDEEGLYTVTLEVTNQCGTSTSEFEVNNYTLPSASITQNKEEACINENVRYFSNASDNAISFEWTLEGANPSTSTLRNPLVQYESGGTYSVTLVVINPAGETTYTFDNTVEIFDEPVAAFTQDNDALSTAFINESENGTTYLWDFGDGMTSTEVNPDHLYGEEGIYTVSLTTTNICGSITTESEFHNYSVPTADFRQNKDFACVGENVRYIQEASSNSVEFEWTIPGANPSTSTAKNVLVTYDAPGTYDVTLIVSNPAGSDDLIKTSTVTIIEAPTTAFGIITDIFNVSFVDQGIGADTYSWDFGDGNTSTDQNPEHTYDDSGSYEVTLSTTNDCGTTTVTQTVEVSMRPTANFTTVQGVGNSACVPATVQYQNLSSSNVETVLWTFPGGSPATSTEFDPSVTYDNVGTYEATLEVFSADDSDAITIESVVVVVDQPVSAFTLNMDVLDIVAIDESEYAESISWFVDGIEVGTGSEFSYLPMFNGEYEIEQTVSNACGEISSRQTIEVTTYPDASFSATERDICEGQSVSYTATFEHNLTYEWTFEGGEPSTSSEQNPTVTYPNIGVYPVELVVTNVGGESDILSEDYVTVGEAPVADPTFGLEGDSTIDASVEQVEGMSYEWYVNGELVSSSDALTYEMTETGTYLVSLIASNECDQLIINEEYQFVRSSTEEDQLFNDVLIMPNPASDYLTITVDLSIYNGMEYRLQDITGSQILRGIVDSDNTRLNVDNIPGGVYILSLNLDDKFKYEKIVISK
jgi:PKD repeat protein